MDEKTFARLFDKPDPAWFTAAETLEACIIGGKLLNEDKYFGNCYCLNTECGIVNRKGTLHFGFFATPGNFVSNSGFEVKENLFEILFEIADNNVELKKIIANADTECCQLFNVVKKIMDDEKTWYKNQHKNLSTKYPKMQFSKCGKYICFKTSENTIITTQNSIKYLGNYCEKFDYDNCPIEKCNFVYQEICGCYEIYVEYLDKLYHVGKIPIVKKIYNDLLQNIDCCKNC